MLQNFLLRNRPENPITIYNVNGKKNMKIEPIKQAQEFIENNVGDRISVEDLALNLPWQTKFERRF